MITSTQIKVLKETYKLMGLINKEYSRSKGKPYHDYE